MASILRSETGVENIVESIFSEYVDDRGSDFDDEAALLIAPPPLVTSGPPARVSGIATPQTSNTDLAVIEQSIPKSPTALAPSVAPVRRIARASKLFAWQPSLREHAPIEERPWWHYALAFACLFACTFGVARYWRNSQTTSNAPQQAASQYRSKPIEQIVLGQRLLGQNPLREQAERIEPEQATWRKLKLSMIKENGLGLEIELLRPLAWIEENRAQPGNSVELDLEELGAVGLARVTALEPCPVIQSSPGTVVTGLFRHEAGPGNNVVRMQVEGQDEQSGVTDNHLYWSADRQCFVAVGLLRNGERIDTVHGLRRILSITPVQHTGYLYNLETTEHVFRVGSLGTLVHNSCVNTGGSYADLSKTKIAGEVPHHMPQNAAGVVSRGKGPALGMSIEDHELTRTYSGRGSRTMRTDAGLTPMQRLELDVQDIRDLFGNKYDKGIAEMMDYAKTLREFQ